MKKCPACAEEILDDAQKCKHCGEWVVKRPSFLGRRWRGVRMWVLLLIGGLLLIGCTVCGIYCKEILGESEEDFQDKLSIKHGESCKAICKRRCWSSCTKNGSTDPTCSGRCDFACNHEPQKYLPDGVSCP
jgi:hypothetical protein